MNDRSENLLRTHSMRFIEMASGWGRRKRIETPDGYGKRTGDCGDTVEIFLLVKNHQIYRMFFDTDGCISTIACANAMSALVEGKDITDAWEIKADDIIEYLETLPSDHHHCAELAAGAFYLALSNHGEFQRSPWKKVYRKP